MESRREEKCSCYPIRRHEGDHGHQGTKNMPMHTCHASCGSFTTFAHNKPRTLLLLVPWLPSTISQSPWTPQTHHGACQDRRTTDRCQSQVHKNQVGESLDQVSITYHIYLPVTLSSTRSMIPLEYGLVHDNTLSGQEPAQDSLQDSSCVVMRSHILP